MLGKVLCDGEYFDHPLIDIVARDVTDLNVDTQVRAWGVKKSHFDLT